MSIVRRLTHALLLLIALVIGATGTAIIVSQTAWFKNWLRGFIVREANQYLSATLSIGRLSGNLFFGIELENVGVSLEGRTVLAVKDLGLDYSPFQLIRRGLSVERVRVNQPVVYLRKEGDQWSITRLIRQQAQEVNRTGPVRPITVDTIGITDGAVVVEAPIGTSGIVVPKRFDQLDAKLAFTYEPMRYTLEIADLSLRGTDPELVLNAASGGIAVHDDTLDLHKLRVQTAETSLSINGAVQQYLTKPTFSLRMAADRVSVPEIARFVPLVSSIRLQPAVDLRVSGPLDHLGVDLDVRSSAGRAVGHVIADTVSPTQSVTGTFSVQHLDLASVINKPLEKSDISGDATIDLRAVRSFSDLNSVRGRATVSVQPILVGSFRADRIMADARIQGRQVGIDARVEAYGASATAAGRMTLLEKRDETVGFDLRGVAHRVDLRALPRWLHAPPATTNLNAAYHVVGTPTNLQGDVRFEPSVIADADVAGGSTAGFAIASTRKGSAQAAELSYQADATVAHLDLQKVGDQFGVPAIAAPRWKSSINGHFTATGGGARPEELDVSVAGAVSDATVLGGRIANLGFEASMAQGSAWIKGNGRFTNFDPSVFVDRPGLKGSVSGQLEVDATFADVAHGVTPDTIRGTITGSLDPSTIGRLEITRASLDGDYHQSTADLRTLEIVGRDLHLAATGTLALGSDGQSALKVHADTPRLDQIGQLVDQPLSGIVQIDGVVTGNRDELQIAGTARADTLKYGGAGALALSSDYTVRLPALTPAAATVSLNTHGTFVQVANQTIDDLAAKIDYHDQHVDFDASAKQQQRSLQAAGDARLGERPEVHLTRLALQAAGMTWQLAPGEESVIQYGSDAIAVTHLDLINSNQRIAVGGSFGRRDQTMNLTWADVELSSLDAILPRPPQFGGRFTGSASVTGTRDQPRVMADFQVNQGTFRQFQYDSFTGTLDYSDKKLTLDATLHENPTAWIEAKGYVPAALLNRAASANEPVDLAVDSSPIDLGLAQGFTTALTGVTGTAEVHLRITGTAADPRPAGTIVVSNGAFKVEANGVRYTKLDGTVDLRPDRVHIDQIHVLDNQQKPLTISGDLALHELNVGEFNIAVKTSDFSVVDNQLGRIRVNSNLRVTGELVAPRVEGDLGVTTGAINLDRLIATTGASPYATSQTQYVPPDQGTSGALEALQVDVHLTVPDDLVVKGTDLRAPDSPVGLGALNVTLGGDLWLDKAPYDQMRPYGVVKTIRGTYSFQGRQFDILRDGTLHFDGLDQLDPTLDVRTQRVIQGVTASVNLRGTLRNPSVDLSSVPPLEQADVLSLIVFNQPINQLGEGQQTALLARAQSLAANAVAGELARSIGQALDLNTFDISTPSGGGVGAQLTVGQQIGQNLYVKVQQGIGGQSQTNVILEYELAKWLRLQTNVLQGSNTEQQLFQQMQGSGADLLFFFSY